MRKNKPVSTESFSCQFSDGTSVSFSVDLQKLQQTLNTGATAIPRPPVKKHLMPEYITWMHTVMATLAKRLGRSIPYMYPSETPDQDICFVYQPDGSYHEIPEG